MQSFQIFGLYGCHLAALTRSLKLKLQHNLNNDHIPTLKLLSYFSAPFVFLLACEEPKSVRINFTWQLSVLGPGKTKASGIYTHLRHRVGVLRVPSSGQRLCPHC